MMPPRRAQPRATRLDGAQGAGTGHPGVCVTFKTTPKGKVPIEEHLHEQERGRLV